MSNDEQWGWQQADARILGQILAAQNIVFTLPTTTRIAEFYAQTLASIPGIAACQVCLGNRSARAGEMEDSICAQCEVLHATSRAGITFNPARSNLKCSLADQPDTRFITIKSYQHHFGFFVFKINDVAVFEVYHPFIINLSNYLAITLENHWQKELLQKAHAELERKVEERTHELTVANEELTASRLVALNMMRDAVKARQKAEQSNVVLQHEIAHRQRAEEALREQYSTLRGIIDSASAIIFSVDRHYRYTSFNQAHAAVMNALYGVKIEVDHNLLEYMTIPEDRETARHNIDRALAGEQLVEEAYSGEELRSRRYFHISHSPIKTETGEIIGVAMLAQDMTERRSMEQALAVQEREYRTLVEHIPDLIVRYSTDLRRIYVNPAWEKASGLYATDVVNVRPEDIPKVPSPIVAEYLGKLQKVLETGDLQSIEFSWVNAYGATLYLEYVIVPEYDQHGNIAGVLSVGHDLTERRRAEEALRESEERYRSLFENSPIPIWEGDFSAIKNVLDGLRAQGVTDLDRYLKDHPEVLHQCIGLTRIINVNQAAVKMHRASDKEELLQGIARTFTTESYATLQRQLLGIWDGKTESVSDGAVETLTGDLRQATLFWSVIPGHEHTFSRVLVSIIDITEQIHTEHELQRSNDLLRAIIEAAPTAIIGLDLDGKVQMVWNPAAERLLGWSAQEAIGHPLPSVPVEGQEEFKGFRERIRRGDILNGVEVRRQKRDGTPIDYSIYASPLHDSIGRIIGNVAVLVDITERKRNSEINAARLHLMQFAVTHSLDELLEETLNAAEKLTGSLIGFYHFVEDDQVSLTLQNWSTRTKAEFCKAEGKGLHYAITEAGVWVDCVAHRKPVIHNDYASLPHRKGMPDDHAEIIRELVVPVLRGEKIKAILGVGNKPTDYTEKDIEATALLADLAWEIAERKQVDEALRESEERFSTIFRYAPIGIATFRAADGRFVEVNDAFVRASGYTREEIIGHDEAELQLYGEHHETLLRSLGEQGSLEPFEFKTRTKSGEARYGLTATVGINLAGEMHYLSMIVDITDRKRAEEAMRQYNQRLSILHEIDRRILGAQSPESIARATLEQLVQLIPCEFASIVLYNDTITEERIFALQQRPGIDLHAGNGQTVMPDQVLAQLKAGQSVVTADLRSQAGLLAPLADDLLAQGICAVLATPMIIRGRLIGALALASTRMGFFTPEHQEIAGELAAQVSIAFHQADLNDRIARHAVELEQRVHERTMQLEGANRDLETFAYSVSHDLRTPLRAIQGFAQIIAQRHRNNLNDEGRRYLDYIVVASEQMDQLIVDLLGYARLGHRHLQVQQAMPLVPVLREVLTHLAPKIDETSAQIRVADDLPDVQGDRTLLKQIFTNLVQNALVYHQPGIAPNVDIRAMTEGDHVIVQVTDNGIGIPVEFQEKIFNVFSRLHNQDEYPGTGIGLAVVRKSVELLNGEVWVESTVMKGSTFYLKLPRAIEQEQ